MNKQLVVGADIGGSHITAALIDIQTGAVIESSIQKEAVNAAADAADIISRWASAIGKVISNAPSDIKAIGIAMPGPFDYPNGIALIKGVAKYESLYGINIRTALKTALNFSGEIFFENDASCFALGEAWAGDGAGVQRLVAITLGTGLGGTFLLDNTIQNEGEGVPPEGYIYHLPYKNGIAEDYISTRWLLREYSIRTGKQIDEVKTIGELAAEQDATALELFETMGNAIGEVLTPWLAAFHAACLVIGGNIRKAHPFFLPALQQQLLRNNINTAVRISSKGEKSALTGAAWICKQSI
ncbi:MAG: ROK family protein [Chitinophaga sp.]|uniref:ROK family protein n=1 Tax=Chitinophaga sp. TaxID=1869181 RepID=UPI0025BACCFE|nr:ROK family protein [Chitinophaga sp.]MBV8253153.1 ROK family protein [Chitinophaga sp.]